MSESTRGVVYEVNLDVEAALAADYRAWLHAHVAQMLALPGFESAQVFDVVEPVDAGRVAWCVHYACAMRRRWRLTCATMHRGCAPTG